MASVGNSLSNVTPRRLVQEARVAGYFPVGVSQGKPPEGLSADTRHFGRTLVVSGLLRQDPFNPVVPYPAPVVRWYRNIWFDPDCMTPTPRTWNSPNASDPTGLYYSGPKCGATPITGARWLMSWLVG